MREWNLSAEMEHLREWYDWRLRRAIYDADVDRRRNYRRKQLVPVALTAGAMLLNGAMVLIVGGLINLVGMLIVAPCLIGTLWFWYNAPRVESPCPRPFVIDRRTWR